MAVPKKAMEGAELRLRCWNYFNFDLEAEEGNMPDVLWLSQLFSELEPELRPIFECLVEVSFAEPYLPEPSLREYLHNPDAYHVEKITFSSVSNYFWVDRFARIIEAYTIAKEEFYKRAKPTGPGDIKVYEAVKQFFDEH